MPYDANFERGNAHFSRVYFGASIAALDHVARNRLYPRGMQPGRLQRFSLFATTFAETSSRSSLRPLIKKLSSAKPTMRRDA